MNDRTPLPYFYRIASPHGHEQLANLELRSLAGEVVADQSGADHTVDRIRWAHAGVDLRSAAYVAEACRLLAAAPDFEGLLHETAKLGIDQERFRITLSRIGDQGIADTREVQIAFGDAMEGRPDLDRPACEFIVIARHGGWLLGELVSRSDVAWCGQIGRAHV